MQITNLNSSSVIIHANNTKILCDPWLIDGEHYGSWAIYPPMNFDPEYYNDIDYIYISHIHHDHCSTKTLEKLSKNIPVIIHRYEAQFLKMNLERLGYTVIEISHNTTLSLKNGVSINLLAADDCNPALCHRYYGCGLVEANYGSTQIDSMAVITDGTHTLVNLNDCPYLLAQPCIDKIKTQYKTIDFLLTGYLGAGPYPQCFTSMNIDEKTQAADLKKKQFLDYGEAYITDLQPRFYMPFAGTYVLAGKLSALNQYRGNPELSETKNHYEKSTKINHAHSQCVLLNQKSTFDIATGTHLQPYIPIDIKAKYRYVNDVLSQRKLDYEHGEIPDINDILAMIPAAYARMNAKRNFINFSTNTYVLLSLPDDKMLKISMNNNGYELINATAKQHITQYVHCKLDARLLYKILQGPRHAHWNNAEGGSHIEFDRQPAALHERAVYYAMNFFHQ